MFRLILILGLFFCMSCQNQEEQHATSVSDKELCDCVGVDENGEWDGHLTNDCINNYKTRFGLDVDKMHEWFSNNCPDYKLKTVKQTMEI